LLWAEFLEPRSAQASSGKGNNMAIQFTDFSKAPLLDSPAKTIFEDVLKGYQMSQEPKKMKEEQSARELANQLRKLEVEHKPKEYELNDQQKSLANALQEKALAHRDKEYSLSDALKQSQITKNERGATGTPAKVNGMVANFVATHPNASQDEIKEFADRVLESQLKHLQKVTDRSADMTAGGAFDKLPTNEKKRAVGLMNAMGVDPIKATTLLRSGVSPTDYAKENNIDIAGVTPVYPLGEENIKQLQRRTGFVNEIKNLEGNLATAMGEYQNKVMGYSLDQVADALTGENPDKQGRVLAARALQPELAALRLKVAGGNIGIEAINELKKKSLGDLKIIEGLVDTKTYLAMQKYMTKWLEDATNEFQRTQEDYGRLKTREQKSAAAESGMGNDPLGLR
jgi:hypothetical protein